MTRASDAADDVSIDGSGHFASSYADARARLLRAAERRGAVVDAHPIAVRGPDGGELAIDVAWLGTSVAPRVLVVSSGLHGVEGYAGSALQHQLLEQQLDGLAVPSDTAIVLLHALNPFGFAHGRRVNESNVDLNRNFLRHPDEHAANPDYDRLYPALNPSHLDAESDAAAAALLRTFTEEHGARRLQAAVTQGQYAHPRGVQFGGQRDEISNGIVSDLVSQRLVGACALVWVDVHTGLGPSGACTILASDEESAARARPWFGAALQNMAAGDAVSPPCHGELPIGIRRRLAADTTFTFVAPEFGTYPITRMMWSLRAENWLHHHGNPGSGQGREIRSELIEVFRPSHPAWQQAVLAGGADAIARALACLAAEPLRRG